MATIFGALNINDSDYVFNATAGQRAVYDVLNERVRAYNQQLQSAMAVFVEETTEDFKRRYKLPGGGRMGERNVQSRGASVKAYGEWDVAFELRDFDEQVIGNDVDMAYMTAAELQRHIMTIETRHTNQMRFQVLKALLNNTERTFIDRRGTLLIEPLANGDSVTYPPVLGSETDATDNHYLESGYAASAISDTNNPYPTIVNEIEEHFGTETGGENIAVFIHPDEKPETEDLTDFNPVEDRFVRFGANADVPFNLPNVPGRILGRANGAWVVEWRFVPSGYMVGVHLEAPAPLIMRVDPAATGLPRELALVSEDADYPFQTAEYRHRFGFGAGNRLNGVVLELGTGGTYSIPSGYS